MKRLLLVPSLLVILGHAGPLQAEGLRVDTQWAGQIREAASGNRETPLNSYFGLGYGKPDSRFSAQTDMRLFRDFSQSLDDYDLYQAALRIRPIDKVGLVFGRQFLNEGFSTEMGDGLKLSLAPQEHVDIIFYSIIPRTVERGDFNRDDGLLTGFSLGFSDLAQTNGRFHFAWRRNDLNTADLRQNDSLRAGLNLSHRFDGPAAPLLYSLAEYDLPGKKMEATTVGVDLRPFSRLALTVEGNYFNIDRLNSRRTVLSLFTTGRSVSGRLTSTWTLISGLLDAVQSYSYHRNEIQTAAHRNGHLLETAFPVSFESIGLSVEPAYYLFNSFGGTVHGGRTSAVEELTPSLFLGTGVDLTRYTKVTQDNDSALSTYLEAGYRFIKNGNVSAGFEYNRNNLFERDLRGTVRLEYHYGDV